MSRRRMDGCVCAVTGASRGMGLEWTKQLLGKGCTVLAAARTPDRTDALKQLQLHAAPGRLILTQLDIASEDSIKRWAAELKEQHDVQHIDYVVNNAAILEENRGMGVLEVSGEMLRRHLDVNTVGPFLVVQQLLAQGLIGGGGRQQAAAHASTLLVHISSLLGSIGDETTAQAKLYAYRASKAALNMIGVVLGRELAPRGVESVLLHPGYVATDMNKHQGTVAPEDSIASMIKVLEGEQQLQGGFFKWTGERLPW